MRIWGRIDFDFRYYKATWYRQWYTGQQEMHQDFLDWQQPWVREQLDYLEKRLEDSGTATILEVLSLIPSADYMCRWILKHPLPGELGSEGCARWRRVADRAKRAKDEGKINDVEEERWEEIRAMYLKVWDLELKEGTDDE